MFTKADIEQYFVAEKKESLLFLIPGAVAILLSCIFFFVLKEPFYQGAAIPFFTIGLLIAVAGFTIFNRSDEDRKRNVYAYDMNPAELKSKELPRMEKVMKNLVVYRYTEILLLLTGAALYIFFIRDFKHDFWRGLGFGLAIMALTALIADYFAEKRGKKYFNGLSSFVNQRLPVTG